MGRSAAGDAAIEALRRVTSAMENAEERQGQVDMVHAVAGAIDAGRSIVVQAGTGTGKSLGYLVPALLSGRKTVVATATKTLQDQLSRHDLPLLSRHLGRDFTWAVVKGRGNYVCRQRIVELEGASGQLEFEEVGGRLRDEIESIVEWAGRTRSGDFEELPRLPSERARAATSVGSDECPGRNRCPSGGSCFAEKARAAAEDADVVVVNLHLYGLHVATEGAILPEHEVVVFDEAHQLESVMSDTVGVQISAGRLSSCAAAVRKVIADPNITRRLDECGLRLGAALSGLVGTRLSVPLPAAVAEHLSTARIEVASLLGELRAVTSDNEDLQQRNWRAQTQAGRLAVDIDVALGRTEGFVAWVEGREDRPALRISPLHVGSVLTSAVWQDHCAVLTSATIPSTLPERVGLPAEGTEMLQVASPFDYESNSRLYCSPEFPDRNSPGFTDFVHDELEALITAAGGRTLALFTSNKALHAAVEAMRARIPFPILTPSEHPRQRLIEMFLEDESSCIFASQAFFQGVDLPGRTLSLVVLDKLPFPRPDEPLLEARREMVGRDKSFGLIDLPIAATSLAQAAGRLIRTDRDRGVVAVLDRRLAVAGYWRTLIGALPPMSRTRNRAEVEEFLRGITAD